MMIEKLITLSFAKIFYKQLRVKISYAGRSGSTRIVVLKMLFLGLVRVFLEHLRLVLRLYNNVIVFLLFF